MVQDIEMFINGHSGKRHFVILGLYSQKVLCGVKVETKQPVRDFTFAFLCTQRAHSQNIVHFVVCFPMTTLLYVV